MSSNEEFFDKICIEFYDEADEHLNICEETFLHLDDPLTRNQQLAKIFRGIHTIKGSGASIGLMDLVDFAHMVEDCLAGIRLNPSQLTPESTSLLLTCIDALRSKIKFLRQKVKHEWNVDDLKVKLSDLKASLSLSDKAKGADEKVTVAFGFFEEPKKTTDSAVRENSNELTQIVNHEKTQAKKEGGSVKIDADRVDSVLDLVSELVVIKSQLSNKIEPYANDIQLTSVVTLLDKTIRELQDKALAIRLTPVKNLFLKMQRLARDLSMKVSKPVELATAGEDTALDRSVVEMLGDPLMHIVRNAIDHGIETGEVRAKAGKNKKGQIELSACQKGGRVIITIKDDGRGINREKVFQKAVERGLLPANADPRNMSNQDVYNFILEPGFSTAEKVTDISGRGVGLDVVRAQIQSLKGSLVIESKESLGTTFVISLPLTASVADGMLVEVQGSQYVIPMDRIQELVIVEHGQIVNLSDDRQVLKVREQIFPLIDAHLYFNSVRGTHSSKDMAVIFDHQDKSYALRVTTVIGELQVVMKPLDSNFPREVVSGATILGDGQVALIADVDGIVRCYLKNGKLRSAS